MTLQEAYAFCWAEYWNCPRFHLSGWAKEVQGYYRRRILPHALSRMPLADISPKIVRTWHHNIGPISEIEANRALEVLSRIFRFAEENEYIPLGSNPCRIVKSFPERKRERYATPDEIRRLWRVLDGFWADFPRDTAFVVVLLLTGARPSSLERAAWKDLGEEGMLKLWGKNTAETGALDTVAVPEYVLKEVFSRIPKREDGLILGPGLPQRYWDMVKKEAGIDGLWARDLRRTFATFGMSGGVEKGVIGELLNHRSSQTTMIYAKLLPQARLIAANRIAEGLIEAMT